MLSLLSELEGVSKKEESRLGQVERSSAGGKCVSLVSLSVSQKKREVEKRDKKDVTSRVWGLENTDRVAEVRLQRVLFLWLKPFFEASLLFFARGGDGGGSGGDPVRVNEAAHFTAFAPIISSQVLVYNDDVTYDFIFLLLLRLLGRLFHDVGSTRLVKEK